MSTNQYLPFATAGGANVLAPAAYSSLASRLSGFTAGTALSVNLNSVWRQASVAAAMLGQFVGDYGGFDALDDGAVATFETSFARTLQRAPWSYGVDTGTPTALAVALSPAPTAYVAGMQFEVKTANACGGACTVNVNALGAVSMVDANGGALVQNSFQAGNILTLTHDGTNFRMTAGYSPAVLTPFSISYAVSQGLANSVFAVSNLGTGSAAFGSSSGGNFTFSRAGKYAVTVQMTISVVYTGPTNVAAGIQIKKNGTTVIGSQNTDSNYGSTSTGFTMSSIAVVDVAAGDVMTAWGMGGSSGGYTSSAITTAIS